MRWLFYISIILVVGWSCDTDNFDKNFKCNLEELPAEKSQHFNALFLGTNLTVENNIPRMVSKLAKSMGDSLFYLTMAPYDYDFERHATDEATIAMIRDFSWDVVVLQESGWRNALPPSMVDTMSFRWADSLTLTIKENNPECRIILFMTPGFANGVKAVDGNWAKTDPDVASYTGMQQRVKQNCVSLAEQLDAEISPCGIMWKIALDRDSTLILFINDKINPTIKGSYLSACTVYSSVFHKKLVSAYRPIEIQEEEANFFQRTVAEALFECNPDWRDY